MYTCTADSIEAILYAAPFAVWLEDKAGNTVRFDNFFPVPVLSTQSSDGS